MDGAGATADGRDASERDPGRGRLQLRHHSAGDTLSHRTLSRRVRSQGSVYSGYPVSVLGELVVLLNDVGEIRAT